MMLSLRRSAKNEVSRLRKLLTSNYAAISKLILQVSLTTGSDDVEEEEDLEQDTHFDSETSNPLEMQNVSAVADLEAFEEKEECKNGDLPDEPSAFTCKAGFDYDEPTEAELEALDRQIQAELENAGDDDRDLARFNAQATKDVAALPGRASPDEGKDEW